jgi:N-acyl-L-homoserine lactone synthetase
MAKLLPTFEQAAKMIQYTSKMVLKNNQKAQSWEEIQSLKAKIMLDRLQWQGLIRKQEES